MFAPRGRNLGSSCSVVQAPFKNVQQIQAIAHAFAAILEDGSVVAWGRHVVLCRLSVQECADPGHCSAAQVFTAILGAGSVVAWGGHVVLCRLLAQERAADPGHCSAAQAFTAILGDGAVVTWGVM